jgi:predicted metal-dependent HD superfamily phosphohydrolase
VPPVSRFAALTGSEAVGTAVLGRYAEPHRRYHDVEHLDEVLAVVDELSGLAADPVAVELAAWYHDAVYDPRAAAGDSERRSAELAGVELTALGLPRDVVAEVERLVLLTAGHAVDASDANGAVFADADLAILGADPERYARYAAAVRAEYQHVPDDDWVAGRTAVLIGFSSRPRLYATDPAHDRFDAAARRNLAWELERLGSPRPGR